MANKNDMRNWVWWDWLAYATIAVVGVGWFLYYGLPYLGMG